MPIAFDPPTHAPHGTLPARGARSIEDDPASLDVFTQLLLAAANVQDAAAPPEPSARAAKDDSASSGDASVLCLPLPAPLLAGAVPAAHTVTIVASEKIGEVRAPASKDGRALVDALRAVRTGTAAPAAVATGLRPETSSAALVMQGSTQASATADAMQAALHAAPASTASTPTVAQPDAAPEPHAVRANPSPVTPAVNALAALIAPLTMPSDKASAATKGVEPSPAAALQAVVPAMTPAAPALHLETISAPAFTPGWQDETVSKLAQVVLTRNERAELKLNPAELGPVNVRVELRADQVSVEIVAASPETRSALEQSLPQLRDLLASQGITLGQASVHDGSAERGARPEAWTTPRPSADDKAAATTARADALHAIVRRADRLLDLYA